MTTGGLKTGFGAGFTGGAVTLIETLEVLFVSVVSGSAPTTVVVFTIVPVLVVLTTIVIATFCPFVIVPIAHCTTVVPEQVPWDAVEET